MNKQSNTQSTTTQVIDQPNHPIKFLSLTFDLPIYPRQIRNWRGAFVEMAGREHDLLHNHRGDKGTHFRYPMIQYRINKGRASVVGMNEGVETIQRILSSTDWKLNWMGKETQLNVFDLRMNEFYLRLTKEPKHYRVFRYLALNADNYQRYMEAPNMQAKVDILQRVIAGHIINFANGVNWQMPRGGLKIEVQNIIQSRKVRLFGNEMIAFNLDYTANILLPSYISLGRGVAHGYGWQKKINFNKRNSGVFMNEDQEIRATD